MFKQDWIKKGGMSMEWYSVLTTIISLIAGGGWFIYYRANKRKANGEATQSEAEGWRKQQEVYESTIESQQNWYNKLKDDFNVVIEENSRLRRENNELRAKITEMENVIFELRKEQERQGRRLDALAGKKKGGKHEGS
jgi:regulator of replication initiation timing